MRTFLMFAAAGAVLAFGAAATAAEGASVEVRDAVARVTVIPENRSDVKVDLVQANPRLPIEVRSFGGRTIVDGGLGRRIRDCHGRGENVSVRVRGVGEVGWKDLPQIVIHTPRDVDMDAGGAVWGTVGRSASLKLGNAGCGDWTVANTKGQLSISEAGSGDVRTGSAGDAHASVAGSGDIKFGHVGSLKAAIAGSGDVTAASVNGWVDASIAGSGDVRVKGGKIDRVKASIAGSGDVTVEAPVGDVDASIMGSGDVRVASASGRVSKSVMGSGSVVVGGQEYGRK